MITHYSTGRRGGEVNDPKPGIVRVFHVAVGRRRKRNPGVALHLVDDPALLGDVLSVVLIHNVLERGEIVLALVAVHTIGNGHQPHIMEREKLLGELAHLNVVPAQPGEVFHEHRRDVPGLDCGDHFLKARALHSGASDAVIYKKDGIGITLVFGGLLENFLLESDLSRVFSPSSNESRHKQYHIFIMLFDHNQFCADCGLYFGNDIFPLNKRINCRCVFRQYLP